MAESHVPLPTEAELRILRVIWSRGSCTVREIHDVLEREWSVGYTTVLKFLQIMHEKGLVIRDESRRTHVYAAAAPPEATQRNLVSDLLDRAFGGSAANLVMQALSVTPASSDDLDRIQTLLDNYKRRQRDG